MLRLLSRCPSFAGWPLALVLLLAGATTSLPAQATTITLQGSVTGNDASVPQGAQVEVRSRETGAIRSEVADAGGRYRVLGLTPGMYDVLIRAIGYRQQRREGVRLVLGQRATVDFALEPGAIELEPIVVSAERTFEVDR